MPVQRSYNVWKTGIILTVKNSKNLANHYYENREGEIYPWKVVAISKTIWEKFGKVIILKVFDQFETFKEAKDAIPEIQKTIDRYKFPR